jgi:translation initiation factor IF-2
MSQNIKKEKENIQPRPPVVVVLGHVDHGKSSILEAIKDFKITAKESGGITQHIGAYEVEQGDKKITFIDTPGHEAFSAMRSRGAKVADIAILVVAAEESVKPQTKEAIVIVKKSGIPMIVAMNKIDKPEADPEKIKRELAKEDVLVEPMGGKIPMVKTSAKTKKGILELLDLILLVAEIQEIKGDLSKKAEGAVIEAYLDSKRGPTATLLVRDGVLRLGDIVATASSAGKVKILEDFQGKALKTALPSQPVVVLGFEKVPQVGEEFRIYSDLQSAEKYVFEKERKAEPGEVFLNEPNKKVLNLILKADVSGSLEAIKGVLKQLPQEKIVLRILKSEVGEINENDVKIAQSAKARILGFRVKTSSSALKISERENFKITSFDIIYELIQRVRNLMEKVVEPISVRVDLGKLKILAVFKTEKNRQIVGGRIVQGEVKRGVKIEVFRPASRAKRGEEDEKIGTGKLVHLQKNKKDIEKAGKGEEVGILYEGEARIEKGDTLVFYIEERRKGEI